jgi:hypothetical protein
MTDWMSEVQAGVDRWISVQRDLWSNLSQATTGTGGLEDVQRRAIEMWRQSTEKIVDAQANALLGLLRGGQQGAGADPEALLRRWTDTQREQWDAWLGAFGQAGSKGPDLGAAGEQLAGTLRSAAEQLVRSQAEWAKTWGKATDPGSGDAA